MTITITLRGEVEERLMAKAKERGLTLDSLAAEILNQVLGEDDLEAAIAKIRLSLQDYEAGNFRDFEDFAQEQTEKYGLTLN